MEEFDLIIIGGGVGGLVTASGAAQLGAKVALIEKESLGGDCLRYGCVPTKRLVHSAKVAHLMGRAEEFGLVGTPLKVDFKLVMEGVRKTQAAIAVHDDPIRFTEMGITVVFGKGRFKDANTFVVGKREYTGRRFLIATGSSPVIPDIPGIDTANVLTNLTILDLKELPGSLMIMGGGPIAIEYAQVFARLGSRVTVIEKKGQILPKEEPELSRMLHDIFIEEGIEILTCKDFKEIVIEDGKKRLSLRCDDAVQEVVADEIMVAVGRRPNVNGLNLEAAGVEFDTRGGIKVDDTLATNVKHIYACGDVSGPYAFTHLAEYQAGIVISNALFPLVRRHADYSVVPWVTYTDPELAHVGITEAEAIKKLGKDKVHSYSFMFDEVDRAIIQGEGTGLIKLVVDNKKHLLGAHILGPSAGELIHELTLAMKAKIPITEISKTIHAYPTISQAIKRACDEYYREKIFTGWFPKVARRLTHRVA
ncbi:MAG: mercuric reductase [Thermodesulfobacteriota bacterium]